MRPPPSGCSWIATSETASGLPCSASTTNASTGTRTGSVATKGTGQLLGFCGWREHELGTSLGYAFAEPTRGNGYAKEATGAVVAWGLANIGAERLYASVRPPNPASCKVLEHTGMTLVREYVDAHGPRLIYALPGSPAVAADAPSGGGPTPGADCCASSTGF